MTCPHAYSDGVYVLGALSPAERSAYEAHLTECDSCAAGVAQLAVLPGLLGRVNEDVLRPVQPEPAIQPEPVRLLQLMEMVAALRRRQAWMRRWRFATALAAVALMAVVAVVATTALLGLREPDSSPPLVAMSPVAAGTMVTADVGHARTAGGTKVWMVCRYPEVGFEIPARTFRLVAMGTDGSAEQLGSWRAGPGDDVELTSLTQLSADDLARLELQGADGTTLLVHRFS